MNLACEFGNKFAIAATVEKMNQFPILFTAIEVGERPVNWRNVWMHIKSAADGEQI